RPEQVILLVTQPSPSFVSVGAWALAVGIFLAAVLAALWGNILKRLRFMFVRLLEVIVAIVAIVVMAYTGLLLQSLHAVPFWATPWLPVLFTLSSLSCGIAIVLGTAQFSGADQVFRTVLHRLVIVDAAVIVLECIAAMGFLMPIVSTIDSAWLGAANGSILAASSAASDLLTGQNAPFFWGGFVLVGLIVPLVLEVVVVLGRRVSPLTTIAMVSSVLVGGFVMRFCVVEAGIHPMLAIVATG
ncbi:MAG: NrfD/PsrC family molybdoenzyme membrane anchor subunit, partial [Raoultibacter sp.]